MQHQLIYKSRFEKIYFDSERQEIFQVWLKSTARINEKKVKKEQIKMAELFEEYKAKYHLADARNFCSRLLLNYKSGFLQILQVE